MGNLQYSLNTRREKKVKILNKPFELVITLTDELDDVVEIGERRFVVAKTSPPHPNWFFYEIDVSGDQIGETVYAHYKRDLMAMLKQEREEK